MDKQERIWKVEEALNKLEEVEALLDEALEGTEHYAHYEAYGKYGINDLKGEGNRFNTSLYDVIDMLRDDEDEDED